MNDDDLKKKYDLVVIGGGPAGVAGALKVPILLGLVGIDTSAHVWFKFPFVGHCWSPGGWF